MTTLADLWRSVFPAARPVGPVDEATLPVSWVRVLKPRVPAFDALERGDLAIVPAAALALVAPGTVELGALVGALAAAPVAGVVIVGSDGSEEAIAERFAEALARAGTAGLVVDRGDPSALERSAIGFLVDRRGELDRQAAELERQIERLALAGRGPDALAAAVGTFLGRAVVIERRRGQALAIHAPADRPAAAGDVARYHARPSAAPFRVPLPGADGRPVGALVLLGDDPVGERDRVACERVTTLLALELARATNGTGRRAGPTGDALPPAGPPWVVLVARQGSEAPDEDSLADREALRRDVRLLAGPGRLVLRGDAASLELRVVAAAGPDDPDALALAGRMAATLGRPVAVSRRFGEPSSRPVAEAEARATLEAVERLVEPPAVARSDRLPAYRLLGSLPDLPDGLRQARALLAPLLVGRPTVRLQRLQTLRAVLDRDAGSDAAGALGVHRNTVAYRVRRIEALGGWDLRDPELRLALSLAVRIVQSAQSGDQGG